MEYKTLPLCYQFEMEVLHRLVKDNPEKAERVSIEILSRIL